VSGTREAGFSPTPVVPLHPVQQQAARALGSREDIEAEIDGMLRILADLCKMEPDQALREISSLTARCTELAVHLHRVEARDRAYTRIRTQQIGPLLEDLKLQKEIAKGMIEMRKIDLELLK
jgi:hypothetical protein